MAKHYKNTGKISGAWEVRVQRPLDDRQVVSDAADLTNPETWLGEDGNYYHYKGMVVSCANTGSIYTYIGDTGDATDVQLENKWIKSSSGSTAGTQVDLVVTSVKPTSLADLERTWTTNKGTSAVIGNMIAYYSSSPNESILYVKLSNDVWGAYTGGIMSMTATPTATISSVNLLSYK